MKKIIKQLSIRVGNGQYISKPLEFVMKDYIKVDDQSKQLTVREHGYSAFKYEQLTMDLMFKPCGILDSEEFIWDSKIFFEQLNKIREEFNS